MRKQFSQFLFSNVKSTSFCGYLVYETMNLCCADNDLNTVWLFVTLGKYGNAKCHLFINAAIQADEMLPKINLRMITLLNVVDCAKCAPSQVKSFLFQVAAELFHISRRQTYELESWLECNRFFCSAIWLGVNNAINSVLTKANYQSSTNYAILDAIDAMHVLYLLQEVHVYNNACIVTLWLDELKHDFKFCLRTFAQWLLYYW